MKAMIKLSLIILTISLVGCEDHSAQDELAKKQIEIIKKQEEHNEQTKRMFNAPGKVSDGFVYQPNNKKPEDTKKPPKE